MLLNVFHYWYIHIFFPSIRKYVIRITCSAYFIIVMSLFGILEKITNWENSSLTSHDSRGLQLYPNGTKFEIKYYGEC